jgi:hypothetical protein
MQRQGFERMLHLIDGFGFRNGWVAFAQVEDFIVSTIMLLLVRLVDENKCFQCLYCHELLLDLRVSSGLIHGQDCKEDHSYQKSI